MISRVKDFVKEKKTIIIVLGVVFFLIFMINYLFLDVPIRYDDLNLTYIEKNGNIEFEYYLSDRVGYTAGMSRPVIYDYDNGIRYRYHFIEISATRWDIWFHPCKDTYDLILDKNGKDIHREDDTTQYSKEFYMENTGWMNTRYLAVYYLNPNGTVVLVWENPDAQNIIERTQAELEPPESYVVKVRR